jgi:hypothetical protein
MQSSWGYNWKINDFEGPTALGEVMADYLWVVLCAECGKRPFDFFSYTCRHPEQARFHRGEERVVTWRDELGSVRRNEERMNVPGVKTRQDSPGLPDCDERRGDPTGAPSMLVRDVAPRA